MAALPVPAKELVLENLELWVLESDLELVWGWETVSGDPWDQR